MKAPLGPGIGIMQGRLLPPSKGRLQGFPESRWRDEFDLAARIGFNSIEWIYEAVTEQRNPIAAGSLRDIQEAVDATGVRVPSICADYFMDRPWVKADPQLRSELSSKLVWLVECAALLGADYIDLPFLDSSSLGDMEQFEEVYRFLEPALDVALARNVLVCLETDLGPANVRNLIECVSHPAVGVCYDVGNSASVGYDIGEEFEAYGDFIRTVHIKDRLRGGGTVPLGSGAADFVEMSDRLEKWNYRGPLVLQAAREDDHLQAAMRSLEFVSEHVWREGREC